LAELRTMAGSGLAAEGGLRAAGRVALGMSLIARFGASLRPDATGGNDHQQDCVAKYFTSRRSTVTGLIFSPGILVCWTATAWSPR
jgi:hypothetical protein